MFILCFYMRGPMKKDILKIDNLCYGPFRDGQSPITKIYPTISQIEDDMEIMSEIIGKNGTIRIYYTINTISQMPVIANKFGLKILPSCWVDKNKWASKEEVDGLVQMATNENVERLLVGDMVLARHILSFDKLVEYIREVKTKTSLPVGTAGHWKSWVDNPKLVDVVDFISIGIPIYDEGVEIDTAESKLDEIISKIKNIAKNKHIIVDSGWPSKGKTIDKAVCSVTNQKRYIETFIKFCHKNGLECFIFEAFDENWKKTQDKVEAAAHYGLFSAKRKPKFTLDIFV